MIRLAILGVLGLVITACGGTAGKQADSNEPAASAACLADAHPDACLRFLKRSVPVRGIRLTAHVPPQVTATCGTAARQTHLKVVCPPLVPIGGVVHEHDLYGPQIVDRRSYSVSINNGQNAGHIHWEFGAIKGAPTKLWVFDRSNWVAPPTTPPARRIDERAT